MKKENMREIGELCTVLYHLSRNGNIEKNILELKRVCTLLQGWIETSQKRPEPAKWSGSDA